jgi:replicative DNA helicase
MTNEPNSLPYSEDAEKGLLCSMLLSRDTAQECSRLPEDCFYVPAHLLVFRALKGLVVADLPIDFVTLKHRLAGAKQLAEIGGPEFLNELFTFVPTSANWGYYADIAKEFYQRRITILECDRLKAVAYDLESPHSQSVAEIVESALTALAGLTRKEPRSFKTLLGDTLEEIERRSHGEEISPVRFGLPTLDEALCGLQPGELAIVGAGTGKGKSALGAQTVLTTAGFGKACAIFSFEMGATQIVERMFSNAGQVSMRSLRIGRLTEDEHPRLTSAHKTLAALPIHIEDEFCVDVSAIISRARQLHAKEPLSLVVVDYIQLVESASVGKGANRETHVSEVVRKLKLLALELRTVVVAMSQLNDDGQLRESRAIGQHADLVFYIEPASESDPFQRKIVIKKGRNVGFGKSFDVHFDGPHMTFSQAKSPAQEGTGPTPRVDPYRDD